MYPGIWTAMYYRGIDTCEALRRLHALGWSWFELSTEHLEELEQHPQQAAELDRVRQTLTDLDLHLPQAHGYISANLAHPDAETRARHTELLLRQLAVCQALGIENVVIHPGTGEGYATPEERRVIFDCNAEAFRVLGDRAGELGLRIGLENMLEWRGQRIQFGSTAEELLEFLAALDHPALGITFDSSHANAKGLDLPATVRAFGEKLICTHLSDNDGSGDQHRTPGNGKIDWPGVMTALREIGYDGMLNLEIPGEEHPVEALQALKVQHALRVAEWLVKGAGAV